MLARHFLSQSKTGRILCLIAALDLFLMMMLTAVDVVGRYGFNSPVKGAYELIEIMMGISVFAILPVLSATGDQISVSLFDRYFSGAWERAKTLFVNFVSLVFLVLMCWRVWHEVGRSIDYGDASPYLRIPMAPLTAFLALMATAAALACAAHFIDTLRGARSAAPGGEEAL